VQIAFTADHTGLQPGECAMLEWSVEGGFGVDLNEHPVERSGQMQVCPEETTPYWLGVDTGETMERREVVISVAGPEEPPPPEEHPPEEQPPKGEGVEFINLMIEPDVIPPGECAMLFWEVMPPGEWPVLLDGQEVPHVGEQEVCPEDTTPYELLVEAPGGPQERAVTLHIEGEPEPEQLPEGEGIEFINFMVEPDMIPAGECAMLFWEVVSPGEWPVLLDGQEVPHVGEQEVCPGNTTTYELWVEAPGGPQERVVTLHIEGEPEPEPPPASPAGPTPPPGVVIDFWVDNNNIATGTCTTLRWHVAHANAVHLDGVGVVGDSSKQICPGSTTVWPTRTSSMWPMMPEPPRKKVTADHVKVSGPSSTPTPTPGGTPSFSADLAVTDLYPDKLKGGTVYGRITNRGPGTCTNVQIQFSCWRPRASKPPMALLSA
jgi:hypothetical protein